MSARDYIARLWNLRGAFRGCFLGPDGKPTANGMTALGELRRFCYGGKPTVKQGPQGVDSHASMVAAGRQEVYFRILDMLNLDDRDLHFMRENIEREADG